MTGGETRVIARVLVSLPRALEAVIATLKEPPVVGVPEIRPVLESKVRIDGSVPDE